MPYYPDDIQRRARRSGLAALLSTAAQAPPGYLGSGLLAGLGPQQEAEQGFLGNFVRQQMEQEQLQMQQRYQEAQMQRWQEEQVQRQRAAEEAAAAAEVARQQQEAEAARRQQIAQTLLGALPPDSPDRPQAESLAAIGEIENLGKLVQASRERSAQQGYYQGQGIDPMSPIAKDLLEKKMGVNQPSPAATSYPQFYPSLGSTFDPRTGTLAPVAGMPQRDREWEEATDRATRVVMGDPLSAMSSPDELAQKIQTTAAALLQVQRPGSQAGLPAVDPAAMGAQPQGGVRVVTPQGALPQVGRGGTNPPAKSGLYNVGGRQITHDQAVQLTRTDLMTKDEPSVRTMLQQAGFDPETIQRLIREARGAGMG